LHNGGGFGEAEGGGFGAQAAAAREGQRQDEERCVKCGS